MVLANSADDMLVRVVTDELEDFKRSYLMAPWTVFEVFADNWSMVKFSPTALNFRYDFFLLVHFFWDTL